MLALDFISLLLFLFIVCGESGLNTPTQFYQLTKNIHIVVDCWNNRLLYTTSFSIDEDVCAFHMVPTNTFLHHPHSVATNGKIMLVESTEANQIIIMKFDYNMYDMTVSFEEIQVLENVGEYPHYITYDEDSKKFLVLASRSLTLHFLQWDEETEQIVQTSMLQLPLELGYTRSFLLYHNKLYIGPSYRHPFFFEWRLDLAATSPTLTDPHTIPYPLDRFEFEDFDLFECNGMLVHDHKLWFTLYADMGMTGPYIESYDIIECPPPPTTSDVSGGSISSDGSIILITTEQKQYIDSNITDCHTVFVNRTIQHMHPALSPPRVRESDTQKPFTPYFLTRFDGRIFAGLFTTTTILIACVIISAFGYF
jgi:hypothetical protein